MKKLLPVILALVMALSVFAGFAVTSSAAPEYVETEYNYDVSDEWGNEETKNNPVFCDGLWMYEWYHEVDEKFGTMEAWFDKTPEGVSSTIQTKYYTAIENSYEYYGAGAGTLDDYYYCMVRNSGKGLHPGINVAPVITFVVPADGKVQYTAKGFPNGTGNTEEKNSTGNHLYVFLDDELVYEEEVCYYSEDKTTYDVDLILDVKEGQKIRYAIGANGSRGSKGWDLKEVPCVVYMEASVPIGNPKGLPPENIMTTDRTADGCTVSWDAVENATGYNVYLNGEKLNSEPITETSFNITGLEPETVYESLTVSSISSAGVESDQSDAKSFRTKQAEAVASTGSDPDSNEDKTSDGNTEGENSSDDKTSASGTVSVGLIIGIVVAAVVVVAIIVVAVVVIVMMMKKMNALTAAQASATPAVEVKPEEKPETEIGDKEEK